MLAEYTARNQQALEQLIHEFKVEFRPLPDDVMTALRHATAEVIGEITARDAFAAKVYTSYRAFQGQAASWHRMSEIAYYERRGEPAA